MFLATQRITFMGYVIPETYLMKVILCVVRNILHEGYSRNIPHEGYSLCS
jgi:hypothetical protein